MGFLRSLSLFSHFFPRERKSEVKMARDVVGLCGSNENVYLGKGKLEKRYRKGKKQVGTGGELDGKKVKDDKGKGWL